MKTNIIAICLLVSLQGATGFTQSDSLTQRVNLIGAYLSDHTVVLRWVPSTPSLWTMSKYYGYRLERCTVDTLTGKQSDWTFPGDSVLKPMTLDMWKTAVSRNPDDLYLQAAGQAHYGSRGAEPNTLDEMILKSDELRNYYSAAILSTEFSANAANASALRFEDDSVEPGKLYIYRIKSLCPADVIAAEPGITSVTTFAIQTFPPIVTSQVYEGEHMVELAWDKAAYQSFYSAFNIYRKPAHGSEWKRINDLPVAFTGVKNPDLFYYRDSLVENYLPYDYQIEGLTPFATKGPRSREIKCMGRDRTPPAAPFNIQTQYLGNNQMLVTWEADPADHDIAGFRISRSHEANEQFLELTSRPLPPSARAFTDTTCNEMIDNFYYIGVMDTAGNVNVGFPTYGTILDSIPPEPPSGLSGSIDTNGVVTITWQPGEEPDIKGYYIHSANRADQTYINLTGHPVQDTVWRDTIPLNVLSETVYYRLVAIDMRYNYSQYSTVLALKKPDRVAPVAPVLFNVQNENQRVILEWYNSTSLDVTSNILQRRIKTDSVFVEVYRCNSLQPSARYEDTAIQGGIEYVYRVIAQDDDGLFSPPSGEMVITAYEHKYLPPVTQLIATVNDTLRKVELSWSYPDNGHLRYAVYRSVNGSLFTSHKMISHAQQFLDGPFQPGDMIMYKIKVINDKSWQSDFSSETIARIALQD